MSLLKAGAVKPLSVTTTERNSITDKQPGLIIYNSEELEAQMWTGVAWIVLGDQPGSMVFKGLIDPTVACPEAGVEDGWFYISDNSGVFLECWTGLGGASVKSNDRIIYDGENWSLFSSDAGVPNLQAVTNVGDTTTNTITAANFTTAGVVSGNTADFSGSGTFAGEVTVTSSLLTKTANDSVICNI